MNKNEKKAIIGVLIIFISFVIVDLFYNDLKDMFGTFLVLLFFIILCFYGLYLILPFGRDMEEFRNRHNGKY